jgi:pyruvate formate lyase activating enzyme
VEGGRQVSAAQLVAEILPYQAYLAASGGGVTVSGGEPLLQPEFVTAVLQQCQAAGLHTALDTSGFAPLATAQTVVQHADLVLLDLKSFDPKLYRRLTHVSLEPTLKLAQYLNEIQKPTWIRFVLVPELTDPVHNVAGLAQFVAGLTNVERLEILPFHQMAAYKWQQLGHEYVLQDTQPPRPELIERVKQQFRHYGLSVY